MIGAMEKIIRNLRVPWRGCGLNKWSGKALLRRWPLNREAKEVGGVSRVGPELGDYEIQGTVSAEALRWEHVWRGGGASKDPAQWRQSELGERGKCEVREGMELNQ